MEDAAMDGCEEDTVSEFSSVVDEHAATWMMAFIPHRSLSRSKGGRHDNGGRRSTHQRVQRDAKQ